MDINYKKQRRKEVFSIETVITLTVILLCLLLFSFFPVKNIFQEIVLSLVFLLLVPYLYIKVTLKDKIENYGVNWGDKRDGLLFMGICFLVMGIFMFLIFNYTGFKETYFLGKFKIVDNYWYLFLYEFFIVNLFVFLYEIFFRGFVMFYFKKNFDIYAVFIQWLIFLVFLDMLERLSLDYVFYVMAAFLAGLVAYKSKSLVYSYLFSIIVLIVGDIIYLKLTN